MNADDRFKNMPHPPRISEEARKKRKDISLIEQLGGTLPDDKDLDFDKLRAVAMAALDDDEMAWSVFEDTFNPALVLQLLDLAQRAPASPQSEKWRERNAQLTNLMKPADAISFYRGGNS